MPLEKGKSKATISHNIHEMQAAGYPHRVAVAAALHTADKSGGKPADRGGRGSSHSSAVRGHMDAHKSGHHQMG
jgi:hypothetical protein